MKAMLTAPLQVTGMRKAIDSIRVVKDKEINRMKDSLQKKKEELEKKLEKLDQSADALQGKRYDFVMSI